MLVSAILLACFGVGIAALEASMMEGDATRNKIWVGGIVVGATFALAIPVIGAIYKRVKPTGWTRQNIQNGSGAARWGVMGAALSAPIGLAFTLLTGMPSSVLMSAISGFLGGFFGSLALVVIFKFFWK